MSKRIEATSKKEAWEIVNMIFPSDYSEDAKSSERAGHPVYRSNIEFLDYICDLGDRLEVNLKYDGTTNVWIVEPEKTEEKKPEALKFIKTDFYLNVNNSSSWIIYITRTYEAARSIQQMAMTHKCLYGKEWYYNVSSRLVEKDCRVPAFFHDNGYWMTCVEYNNGDWNRTPTYALYIVE